jgi:hypothetical protein
MKDAEIDKKKAPKSDLRPLRGLWMVFYDNLLNHGIILFEG